MLVKLLGFAENVSIPEPKQKKHTAGAASSAGEGPTARARPGTKESNQDARERAAIREVLTRKAAAFWVEDTPRTTLRHLLHDTIPTGPPCRTPPHNLKGEEAEWVDQQL